MKLSVNPNRMELLRLRRRLVLAERGHKLLKDKLEEIMRRFLRLVRRLFDLEEEVSRKLEKVLVSFALVRARTSFRELEKLIPEGRLILKTERERIFNLTVPRFEIEKMEIADYDLLNTESELDIGIRKAKEVLKDMLELAHLWKAVELLSHEIDITRRRVNALEHILIPNIRETISYISGRLEEMERSYQVQLMRVKEIVRGH
jgi:V/A-type H+-transporting ATPase subunit D